MEYQLKMPKSNIYIYIYSFDAHRPGWCDFFLAGDYHIASQITYQMVHFFFLRRGKMF
jgi:hypothetical protein